MKSTYMYVSSRSIDGTLYVLRTRLGRLGSITVGRWTCVRKVVGSTPGRDAIKWLQLGWVTVCEQYSQHQGQLSVLSLRDR